MLILQRFRSHQNACRLKLEITCKEASHSRQQETGPPRGAFDAPISAATNAARLSFAGFTEPSPFGVVETLTAFVVANAS